MLFKNIDNTIASLKYTEIRKGRKKVLQLLIDHIQSKVNNNKNINLNFICTHNSRRSHLSQVWAQVAAYYYSVKNVYCYSGGTEATAVFPMVVKTLERAGFEISILSEVNNPVYGIKYGDNELPVIGFSKTYDNAFNPKKEFTAIMTCSHADANCPFIPGAKKRISIQYDDPKEFDHTEQQAEKYQERSEQIATEMLYVFSQINKI